MHRITIMLPRSLKAKANRKALKNKMSLGELIRLALERECVHDRTSEAQTEDPFLTDTHFYKGNIPGNLTKDYDDYLY